MTTIVKDERTAVQSAPARAYWALTLGILSIGFSAIFVRWADAPGAVTGFYRMLIAVIALAVPFIRYLGKAGYPPRREVLIALAAGIFFGSDLIFWNTGILISGAANPTLMANTAPVWVGLGAMLIFKEKLGVLFWTGLAIALGGAALILGADIRNSVGLGTLLGLIAGIFYAGYLLIMQRSRRALPALPAFWLACVGAMVMLFIVARLQGESLTDYSLQTWLAFLAMGLISQVLGQLLVSYALGALPASLVSPTLLGQPALTMLLAIPLLGEIPTPWHVLGGAILLIGVYIVHRSRAA
ncbi:MAG: DMT family transporter [Caldilineaceae bacterium]|nr:DMT family transporter [Caldilineaceae bacterium]MCB9138144.1 DMT family transporter [Caldilineaceae bacterium]